MEFQGVEELMRRLKAEWDSSETRSDWRALTGRDHVSGSYDTFVFSDRKVYQIKAREFAPRRMVAVGSEMGQRSDELLGLMSRGAPVPLGVLSRCTDASLIMMVGMQHYSSDAADELRREYFPSGQDVLKGDLDAELDRLLERPGYRRAFRSLDDDQSAYFA
jgi:hypothetical protein